LLEDQYGVGDMIEVESATGRVEVVSLRSTQLRTCTARCGTCPTAR
ncbi:MAG: mechanosensitive ion channel, partial [Acidimicrobiia bacterium]|nr:mechanosensitive ion channel [Acidimicrobiia bacterium]